MSEWFLRYLSEHEHNYYTLIRTNYQLINIPYKAFGSEAINTHLSKCLMIDDLSMT